MLSILGLSWILASLGVFIRDVPQTIGILVTILMFLSPVFIRYQHSLSFSKNCHAESFSIYD
jgi:ABC-type polysaccharide/polyol phosphate export permease